MKKLAILGLMTITTIMSSYCLAEDGSGVDVAGNFSALFGFAGIVAGTIGVFLFGGSLYQLYTAFSGRGQASYGQPIFSLIIASLLISIGWFYNLIKGTIIGDNSDGVTISGSGQFNLALDQAAASAALKVGSTGFGKFMPENTLKAVLAFIMFIGFCGLISGVFGLKDAFGQRAGQNPVLGPAIKIIGGCICMNITWFGCLVSGLLGVPAICLV